MEILLLLIRLFLFGIFALAGIGKLFDLKGSKKAVEDFGVPEGVSKPVSVLLPVVEIAIAIVLLPIQTSWFGAIGGGSLLIVFVGGMLWQMWQGNAPDCHCFGQIHSEPVSKKSLLRNGAFAALAFFLVAVGPANQGLNIFDSANNSEMNGMQIILGIAVIGFLAAIVYFLKVISEQQNQIMRRIEVLELISHEGGKEVERDDVNDPVGGLPLGAPVPEFVLADLSGLKKTFDYIVPPQQASLVFFVSPSCNPCEALVPEIQEWKKDFGERMNFVFITSGKAKDNIKKFEDSGFDNMFVQEENEIADLLYSEWTPTAIFINADRTIASHPAAGDSAIRELIEKIKEEDLDRQSVFLTNGDETKIGESVPDFSLEDLEGKEISAEYFNQKKTLVTYWSTGCPHCVNMLDGLREWDESKGEDAPNLLVISSGETDSHKDMGLKSPVVLDNEHSVASEFGMEGTPSAVLVSEDGRIVSETAVGAQRIWELLGRREDESD